MVASRQLLSGQENDGFLDAQFFKWLAKDTARIDWNKNWSHVRDQILQRGNSCNMHDVNKACDGHALSVVGKLILEQYCESLTVNVEALQFFLEDIEGRYRADIPYHSAVHGADVSHEVALILHHTLDDHVTRILSKRSGKLSFRLRRSFSAEYSCNLIRKST